MRFYKTNSKLILHCITLTAVLILPSYSVFAETVAKSNVGTLRVDGEKIVVGQYQSKILKIYGNVTKQDSRDVIILAYTMPDGTKDGTKVRTTRDGYFESFMVLDGKSLKGKYEVLGLHDTKIIGSIVFNVVDNSTSEVPLQNSTTNVISIQEPNSPKIPDLFVTEFCAEGPQTLDIVLDETNNSTSIKLHCIKKDRAFSITVIDNKLENMMKSLNMSNGIMQVFSKKLENQTEIKTANNFQINEVKNDAESTEKIEPRILVNLEPYYNEGVGLRPAGI